LKDFRKLDKQISTVASKAVRIGDKLETIDKERERCLEAIELIQYFLDLNR